MKEMFDWLREQIDKRSFIYASKDSARRKYIDCSDLDTIINEAEAKWKDACCEWKLILGNTFVAAVSHENEVFTQTDMKFCPYCGKPIKIAEVERWQS